MYTGQKVGYARVSSTGQSLEVQIEKESIPDIVLQVDILC